MQRFFENIPLPALIVCVFAILSLAVFFFFSSKYASLWLQAFFARGDISLLQIVAMSIRKVDVRSIVEAKVKAAQGRLEGEQAVTTNALESHYLAGGDVNKVVEAMIAAQRSGVTLPFHKAAAYDLAGKDIMAAVQSGREHGESAVASTDVYPAGRVTIDGVEFKAVSMEDVIHAGQPVRIVDTRDDVVYVCREKGHQA